MKTLAERPSHICPSHVSHCSLHFNWTGVNGVVCQKIAHKKATISCVTYFRSKL